MHPERRYDPESFANWVAPEPSLGPVNAVPVAAKSGNANGQPDNGVGPSDDDVVVVDRIRSIKPALWGGDHSAHASSSEADLALCGLIAWLVGADAGRIDRIFRRSGLYREKWLRDDYRTSTIAKAMEQREFYDWSSNGRAKAVAAKVAPAIGDADLPNIARLLTDVGNAARFVLRHEKDARFCYGTGKWMIWAGKRWTPDDTGRVSRWAQRTALNIYREVADEEDGRRQQLLAAFAKASQKRERISAMIELAKPYLAVTTEQLDADPYLLNVQNGTVDLRSGQLREHRREDYLTKLCNASYKPCVAAPIFTAFLARIFRTYPNLIRFVQKAIGYGATGVTSEQVLFFLYGTGANGKTTLLDAAQLALGDYAGKADRELLSARDVSVHPTNIADLMGRRLVVCSETNEGGRFDEGKLKDLVGETRLKARFMRQDFFEFTATHKVFLYSNHKPLVRGTDYGFWRRMRLIPFIETITDDEKDTELPDKLKAEVDGILTWIVDGAVRWQQEGLGLPDEVAQATAGYRSEMDSIGAFLSECCLFEQKMSAMACDLYAAYVGWCEDNGEKPLSQKRLGMQLAERGLQSDRDSYSNRKLWRGIGLSAATRDVPDGI